MSPRRTLDLLAAGVLWGGLAFLLGRRAFGPPVLAGMLGAPLIGLAVGAMTQPAFERLAGGRRMVLALGSVYLGATGFGLAIGIGTWLGLTAGSRRLPAVLIEPVLGSWWGVTMTGFWLALWPLAYATHWLLEWRGTR